MRSFKYPIVRQLYKYDTFIDPTILRDILAIGQPVVPDLILMLEDTIENQEFYKSLNGAHCFFIEHALLLLQELEATESYPTFLRMMSQEEAYQELWFGESLEDYWTYILKCGKGQWAATEAVIMNEETAYWTRFFLINMISYVAQNDHVQGEKIIDFLDRFLSSAITEDASLEANLFNSPLIKNEDLVASIICAILNIGEKGSFLQPKIKEAYKQNIVARGIVDEESALDYKNPRIRAYKNIFAHYERANTSYAYAANSPFRPKMSLIAQKRIGLPNFRQRLEALIDCELEERIDFKFPAVKRLYHKDVWLTEKEIQDILDGGTAVGEDLIKMLLDLKSNYVYFQKDWNIKWNYDYLLVDHILYFLMELKEPSYFLGYLDFLACDKEIFDSWVSDEVMIMRTPDYVAEAGRNYLAEIKAFIQNKSNNEFARTSLTSGLQKMAAWYPETRAAVVQLYKELLEYFSQDSLRVDSEDYEGKPYRHLNYEDSNVLAHTIMDINGLGARELLPPIKEILAQGFLYSDVEVELKDLTFQPSTEPQPTITIFERYKELQKDPFEQTSFHNPNSDAYLKKLDGQIKVENARQAAVSKRSIKPVTTLFSGVTHKRTEKKVGRNEPCPCGSKKKYKKCCLKKK